MFCHYQPYWNKKPGQFARTADYKLYRDGRFYQPAKDLKEQNDLAQELNDEKLIETHRKLQSLLEAAPPSPTKPGSANTKNEDRHVFPKWKKLPLMGN